MGLAYGALCLLFRAPASPTSPVTPARCTARRWCHATAKAPQPHGFGRLGSALPHLSGQLQARGVRACGRGHMQLGVGVGHAPESH